MSLLGLGTLRGEHQRPFDAAAEWEKIPQDDWNVYQRVADRTNGWITPGNVASTAGVCLTVDGLLNYEAGQRFKGVVEVFLGRCCDIADGLLAKKTGTRSAKGAGLDASYDKYGTGAALIMLEGNGISLAESLVMGAAQADIVLSSADIYAHGSNPDPKAVGKLAMFKTWLWIGGRMSKGAADMHEKPKLSAFFERTDRLVRPAAFGLTALTAVSQRRRLAEARNLSPENLSA